MAALLPHDLSWIQAHAPDDGSVRITELSSSYVTIGLWGPKARDVLSQVTDDDLSNDTFPYYTGQQIEVGAIPVTALRISYVGELGWELYTRTEYATALWDKLWEVGQAFNMVMVGGGAFDSLRLEKGYRLWGADIHTDYNPYEAGIGWAVKLKKDDFIGKESLEKIKMNGVTRKLCCLTLDTGGVLMGKEPVVKNGKKLGYVTSANYGYSVGKFIAYAYLPIEHAQAGEQVEIMYFNEPISATVSDEPLFDKGMARLKG